MGTGAVLPGGLTVSTSARLSSAAAAEPGVGNLDQCTTTTLGVVPCMELSTCDHTICPPSHAPCPSSACNDRQPSSFATRPPGSYLPDSSI